VGREIARLLSEEFDQSVVVINASGGHGVPAMNKVLSAPADGYTLLLPASGYMTIPSKHIPEGGVLSVLTPISQLTQSPHVLVSSKSLPVNTTRELVDYARKNPGQVIYGSAGVGGLGHLGMELFNTQAQVKMTHAPYRGTSAAITDLAAGRVHLFLSSMPSLKPMLDKGAIKVLGITAPSNGTDTKGLSQLSDVVPGMEYMTWYGLFAKTGTPPDVISTLNAAIKKVLQDPRLNEGFRSQGIEFVSSTPEALEELVKADTAKWAKVISDADIKLN
jgi:tripartite-type tricarboxylate transporter receptor subunit TctC